MSVKKNTTMVSSMVILETQKKPGVMARIILEIIAVLGPYILLASSKTTHIDRSEKVAATNLPVSAPMPIILKYVVANMS